MYPSAGGAVTAETQQDQQQRQANAAAAAVAAALQAQHEEAARVADKFEGGCRIYIFFLSN